MSKKDETGKIGETAACAYLKKYGYRILHTNWRFGRYELDIVATSGEELVIIEVKTRAADHLVAPEESVNAAKIRRIVAAADAYVQKYHLVLPVRFDVVFLTANGQTCVVDEHIEDAFFAPVE
ncbi:MAG: YraN family protein [Tannerella sp.]|nr:YraN family protein [Tannerella sp.]